MTDQATRIRQRAAQQQRKGNAGNAVKLHILASEVKTLKLERKGDETTKR